MLKRLSGCKLFLALLAGLGLSAANAHAYQIWFMGNFEACDQLPNYTNCNDLSDPSQVADHWVKTYFTPNSGCEAGSQEQGTTYAQCDGGYYLRIPYVNNSTCSTTIQYTDVDCADFCRNSIYVVPNTAYGSCQPMLGPKCVCYN